MPRRFPGQMKAKVTMTQFCLIRPDVMEDIYRADLAAGADIIKTNTFSSTCASMG